MNDGKINLTFYGGAEEVTGANFVLEVKENGRAHKIAVDCGLSQGSQFSDEKNREPFPYNPAEIETLLITHAHIDHIGRVPKFVREGFKGRIISTPQTKELAEYMLADAEHLMEEESRDSGVLPIYDKKDVEVAMQIWQGVSYGENFEVVSGVSAVAKDAGHVLGSAMFELEIARAQTAEQRGTDAESRGNLKVVFTGDLGNSPSPLLRDTEVISDANYLIMESVYGDRNHEDANERRQKLKEAILCAIKKGGALLIPIFSLEKTQVILYELNALVESGEIPEVPVFLDSPLAIKLTGVYKNSSYLFNEKARESIKSGDDIFRFPKLRFTETRMESGVIAGTKNPKIIIAGSGMSTGGRIIRHEQIYLSDPRNTILFVGYQSAGSLGRQIEEGMKNVSINGQKVNVKAEIAVITGYSSHKDRDGLVAFVENTASTLKKVFVVMGEPKSSMFLAQRLKDYLGVDAIHPEEGETVELS